jgi:hypothetical protein
MDKTQIGDPPDLVLNRCPLGCRNCTRIWINEITNHRIVCNCVCNHKVTLAQVWGPEANTMIESSSSSEGTKENDLQ